MKELNRREWYALCDELRGSDDVEIDSVSLRRSYVDIDIGDGLSNVTVSGYKGATDVRVNRAQLLVGNTRAALVMQLGTYPIARWAVLWEGELPE